MKKKIVLIILLLAAVLLIETNLNPNNFFFMPRGEAAEVKSLPAEVVAENLEVPWEIVFLPESHDGMVLVSERPGRISVFSRDWEKLSEITVESEERGESGLMGLALHPDFSANSWVYLYATFADSVGSLTNRVERYEFRNFSLENRTVIVENIPGAVYHDGGRIVFGDDGLLYIATGDAADPESAQNINSLSGKVLRLTDEGEVPDANPLKNEVFSYGHRNPQGLSFDDEGRLWSTEHGRSGISSGLDEINLIRSGYNYGWPQIQGSESKHNLVQPAAHSGPDVTWAPADVLWVNGFLLFPGLRGESLYLAELDDDDRVTSLSVYLSREYGRLRAVSLGPDESVYVSTSNLDGRGRKRKGDDKILKIRLSSFDRPHGPVQ